MYIHSLDVRALNEYEYFVISSFLGTFFLLDTTRESFCGCEHHLHVWLVGWLVWFIRFSKTRGVGHFSLRFFAFFYPRKTAKSIHIRAQWLFHGFIPWLQRRMRALARCRRANIFSTWNMFARILYPLQYHNHVSAHQKSRRHEALKIAWSWCLMEKCTYVYHIVFGIVRIGAADVQAASILHWLNDANVVSAFENLKNQFELYVIQNTVIGMIGRNMSDCSRLRWKGQTM